MQLTNQSKTIFFLSDIVIFAFWHLFHMIMLLNTKINMENACLPAMYSSILYYGGIDSAQI